MVLVLWYMYLYKYKASLSNETPWCALPSQHPSMMVLGGNTDQAQKFMAAPSDASSQDLVFINGERYVPALLVTHP